MSKRRTGTHQVHTITSAPAPLGDDIARRARRYMLQMGLRTVCFIGAVLSWGRIPTAVSVILLVGAVVLPYVAVVLVNAGRERPAQPDPFPDLTRQLAAVPAAAPAADHGTAWSGTPDAMPGGRRGDAGRTPHDGPRRDGTPADRPHRG